MKLVVALATLALSLAVPPPALAAGEPEDTHTAVKLHGVVNSINTTHGRINITHDPVPELKWPSMKMNFRTADPTLLKDIKSGMTVDFEIEKREGQYLVTKIAPVN